MEIPKELKNEIWNYCMVNDITNIDDFILSLIKQGFTIHKYGMLDVKPIQKKEEPIVEIAKEDDTLQLELNKLKEENNRLKNTNSELKTTLQKNKKDLYGE